MEAPSSMTEQPVNQVSPDANVLERQGSAPLDGLSAISMIYLGIPLALFFGGWLKVPFALILLFALVFGFVSLWRRCHVGSVPFRLERAHLILLGVAIAWASFGGAGHLLYANRWDWSLRDAVLRDLTAASWPPGYDIGGPVLWMLRCPVGYFLPAALGGKIFGLSIADTFLWVWTVIGVWIFLSLLPIDIRRYGKMALAVLIVVLFSGMDILGWWFLQETTPPIYKHMEWWAVVFQYSSNTTLLFWTPNHAIPAWIAAALFWRHWKTDGFIAISPLLLALLPIWSPFPMIGMLPFYVLLLVRIVRENKWRIINLPLLGISLLIIAVVGAYLSTDIGGIPSDYALNRINFSVFFGIYTLFVLFEFGVLCTVIWILGRGQILLISAAVLLLLPFIRFGPGNDLVMRGSIPALTFICIATVTALQRPTKELRAAFIGSWIVLLLGAVTPFHEFYRASSLPSWKPNQTLNVMNYGSVPPAHYVARVGQTWRSLIFRDLGEIMKTSTSNKRLQFSPEELP